MTFSSNGLSVISYADELTTKDGELYYLDNDGNVKTGWQTIDGNKYFFQKSGAAVTKSCVIDGIRYKSSSNGVCQGKYTGWRKSSNGRRYYKDGVMLKERWIKTKSCKLYYVGDDGYMTTGWYRADNGWCYFNEENGQMSTGDVEINGNIYTFSADGIWDGFADYDNTKIYNTLSEELSKDNYGGIYLDKNAVVVMSKNDSVVKNLQTN